MVDSTSTTAISVAWAACPRWAVRESADIIDIVEQPAGQACVIMVDVQGTGGSPRRLGNSMLLEARAMLTGGVSIDLVAHSLNQLLHSRRDGQVGATVVLAAISVQRQRAEIAAYGDAMLGVRCGSDWSCQELRHLLAGHDPAVPPDLRVVSLDTDRLILLASDGVARTSDAFLVLAKGANTDLDPPSVVDGLIAAAISRDRGRPAADMAAVAVRIVAESSEIAVERGAVVRPVRTMGNRR